MLLKFPPNPSEWQEKHLKAGIEDWELSHGVVMLGSTPGVAKALPVTMYPSPFSRSGLSSALEIQTLFNSLYHSVVRDPAWILEQLKETAKYDDFTQKLINVFQTSMPKRTQKLTGGIFRSDYLLNEPTTNEEGRQIKQVEFNTISVSFGALSTKVTELHKFLCENGLNYVHGDVHVSPSLREIASGLAEMHKAFVRMSSDSQPPLILFVVQPDETNVIDQKLIEYELLESHDILSRRVTLEQVSRQVVLDDSNRLVYLPRGQTVSVVYYRAGYSPNDYPTSYEWDARLLLESSHAIQCPSVLTQLAGSKKIQELLTRPNILRQFVNDDIARDIEKTFVKIWPLDSSELGKKGRELALTQPDRFVLKPQREGGGNNVYRDKIPSFLNQLSKDEWAAYILMELIQPPKISNKIVRDGSLISGHVVNELGVFGTVLWDLELGEQLMSNQAGWLLRTKLQKSDEGGVAAGYGCIDAILLPEGTRASHVPSRRVTAESLIGTET